MQEELKGSAKVGTTVRGIGLRMRIKNYENRDSLRELRNFDSFSAHYRQNLEMLKKCTVFRMMVLRN